jgi:hypothetical protein
VRPKRFIAEIAMFAALAAAALSPVLSFGGNTCTWSGAAGDGRLDTAGNWDVAPVSGNGDTLVIDIGGTAATIVNGTPDFSVSCLKLLGQNDVSLTLDGERIVISPPANSSDWTQAWTNHCSVTVNTPIRIDGKCLFGLGGLSTVFNGDISLTGAISWRVCGRPLGFVGGLDLAQGTATIEFNGAIYGPQAAVHMRTGANGAGTWPKFYGKVTVDSWYNAEDTCPCQSTFLHSGNEIPKIVFTANQIWCGVDNVFTEDTLIQLGRTTVSYIWDNAAMIFLNGARQVANRLGDGVDCSTSNPNAIRICARTTLNSMSSTSAAATLTLKGTADAVTYIRLEDTVSVVWDPAGDFTQDFRNREHTTKGSLVVKGGTMRVSGKNSFLNVPSVDVISGAFDVSSTNSSHAALPSLEWLKIGAAGKFIVTNNSVVALSAGGTIARISTGGKFVLAGGVALDFAALLLDGVSVAADTYTSANCSWIEGAGSVVVRSSNPAGYSFWKSATSGSWNDAGKWNGGVPGASTKAYVWADGAEYTIAVDSSVVLPASLEVAPESGRATVDVSAPLADPGMTMTISTNGVLKVSAGGSFTSTGKSSTIAVKDGGQWLVDGGNVVITNFSGSFFVSGTGTDTGRITVASGLFRHCTKAANSRLSLRTGGLFEATGGRLEFPYDSVNPLYVKGGRLAVVGNVEFTPQGIATPYPDFGTGETVFSGSSRFLIESTGANLAIRPGAANETAYVTFRENAWFQNYIFALRIGGTMGGIGRVDFAGPQWQGRHEWKNWDIAVWFNVGCNAGYGEMNVMDGLVPVGACGLSIAGLTNSNNVPSGVVQGRVNVSGGCMRVLGTEFGAWSKGPHALVVGDGMYCRTVLDGHPFEGELHVSGGSVTNVQCNLIVGGGYGKGYFEMTGGETVMASAANELMVGFAGGLGTCAIKGGSITGRGNVYVGGSFTNVIGQGEQFVDFGCPVDRHDAEGALVVSGGIMQFGGTCYVGANGAGTVEMSGTGGTLSLGGLVTSNTTAIATSSALKFTLGADGVSPIVVSGGTKLTDGTKIGVDFTKYTNSRSVVKLIGCSGITADLDALDVTFTGVRPGLAKLRLRPDGLYACLLRGMSIKRK